MIFLIFGVRGGKWPDQVLLGGGLKLYLPICVVSGGLDMPSSMYNTIMAMKCISEVFFGVKISSTHYQVAVLVTNSWFVYIFICKQSA